MVHSIFDTIQGEGIFSGHPATFLRLIGCNIRCPSCDTEYTNDPKQMTPHEIVDEISSKTAPNKLVVISGGEPLRQNLYPTVSALICAGFKVQIETNGTLPLPNFMEDLCDMFLGKCLFIMCSPKGRINHKLAPYISAYKYVLSHTYVNVENGLPTKVLDINMKLTYPPEDCKVPIFLQPMDSQDEVINRKHLDAVLRSCYQYGYTLCLQVHKIIDVE